MQYLSRFTQLTELNCSFVNHEKVLPVLSIATNPRLTALRFYSDDWFVKNFKSEEAKAIAKQIVRIGHSSSLIGNLKSQTHSS